MVQRIILDKDKFLVSQPGTDVTTATASQLIFDSRNQKYYSAYASGVIPSSSFAYVSSASGAYQGNQLYRSTLYYGKTFAAPPKVFLSHQTSLYDNTRVNSIDTWYLTSITSQLDPNTGFTYSVGDYINIYAYSYQSYCQIDIQWFWGASYYYLEPQPSNVYYLITTSA